ncbi:MAG: hypothetical protein H0X36_12445 [Sphingomonadaceae bacterium]|nr:hypothetical protein [Sphingomonadaceae bacterium]
MLQLGLAALAPLLLASCLLAPGKFASTLTINADRSFAFTYKGEVIDAEPDNTAAEASPKPGEDVEAKRRAIAEALRKEVGYRSVAYLGKGKFAIDYAISGTLDHNFSYPLNSDAEIILPFIMVELRQGNLVRVRAPGYSANQTGVKPSGGMPEMPGGEDAGKYLDGTFTLDTDAEVVSQNSEEGVKPTGARRTIVWRATPLTKDAPAAVLRLSR